MEKSGFRSRLTSITSESDQEIPKSPLSRRTTRLRKQPKKYGDFLHTTPTKRRVRKDDTSDEEIEDLEGLQKIKPTALFSTDDVEGQNIFNFKTRHTKIDLQNIVNAAISNTPNSNKTPKTPSKVVSSKVKKSLHKIAETTPRHVKNIIKKRIIQEVESDSDFTGDSTDDSYIPDRSENETASSQSSENETSHDEETQIPQKRVQILKGESKTKSKDSEYIITPDNYFMMHSSKTIQTSDHTLARLKFLSLDENEAENITLSNEHEETITKLIKSYTHLFNKWLYVLSENFNIILYGIGSKQSVIQKFQIEKLKDFPCVVVNGFFPSLTLKSILESIVIDLLGNNHIPANIGDTVSLIDSQLTENEAELFLIIHNIDGAMLRNSKTQAALASLSQIKNVHMIATIDHINAPLLWDHSKLSKFKFSWWDVTTFLPYSEETSFENSLMSHRSGGLQLYSLKSVYQSLNTNAKEIFNIIIVYQLENQKQTNYQGLAFKDLYSKCREEFLVSSELVLRAQLTEFLDHKLVKMKRTYDGNENLIIPVETVLLQQFLEELKS